MIRTVARRLEWLATWNHERQVPAVVFMVFVATIFFSGSNLPRSFYVIALLPLSGLALFGPGRNSLANSTVLWACMAYLLAMDIATLLGPDATGRQLWSQVRNSALIAIFLLIGGGLVSAWPRFCDRFFAFVGMAVATSAAINIYLYFRDIAPDDRESITAYRLVTSLGMPGYSNSTNISATYAVFFIGALATGTNLGAVRPHRALAMLAAVVLFLGVALTQSRSALLAVAIGVGVLALTRSRRVLYAVAAAAIIVFAAALIVPDLWKALFVRGLSNRPEVWGKFLDLIVERPWIGYGSFSPIVIKVEDVLLDQAHNLVLSGWFRGGVLAAVAMAFILAGGVYWSFAYWKSTRNATPLAVMMTIAAAGMFDYQLMITAPTWPWVTFWLPFGLAVGAEMAVRRMRLGSGVPACERADSVPAAQGGGTSREAVPTSGGSFGSDRDRG